MNPPPYNEKSGRNLPWHTTFIGQRMQHNFWIYAIIDKVMAENPQIKSIVEIGTGSGALSSVFGLWGVKRNIPVLTIDKVMRHTPAILSRLGVEYMQADVFSDQVVQRVEALVGNSPTWIYCDGGSKRREVELFAPLVPADSIISAHDYQVEFFPDAVASGLIPEVISPYRPEWWMDMNVQLAMYKKT